MHGEGGTGRREASETGLPAPPPEPPPPSSPVPDPSELLEHRFQRRFEHWGARLETRLEQSVGGRLERVLAARPPADSGRVDTERIAGVVHALEERIDALQRELENERGSLDGLQAELSAERERCERAERARASAREETSQYRRVLAAAVANEKYAIELARRARQEGRELNGSLQEAVQARGRAEGRAQELERRLAEVAALGETVPWPVWRAVSLSALAALLALVAIGHWTTFLARQLSPSTGVEHSPSNGFLLLAGLGALSLAVPLAMLGRKSLRSALARGVGARSPS